MLTEQEKEEIIEKAVEKALLRLPEVVNNLIMSRSASLKLGQEFKSKHQDLFKHEEVVKSVIAQVETDNPGLSYPEVLERSLPIIRQRIGVIAPIDTKTVQHPERRLDKLLKNNGVV